ncbi:MAG: hypothetical protein R3264_20725 [Anaerolineae bacterium]|nr:hypothetical protein [Anaerolineae bacterium]
MNTSTIVGKVKQLGGQKKTQKGINGRDALEALAGKQEELVGMAQEKYGQIKEKAQEAVVNVSTTADAAKQKVDSQLNDYNAKMKEVADRLPGDVNETITRYPWVTVVTALGVGVVVGMWLKPGFKR